MIISAEALDDLARRGAARGVDPGPGLETVEQRLRAEVASDLSTLDDAARYLSDAGGKRFRPSLTLLTGMLGGRPATDGELVTAAVIVELVHLSTLYHDDVIDGADVRRGQPSAHVRWSNSVAILTGDFLLARASVLSASLGTGVTDLMARTIAALCEGQIREVQGSALGHAFGSRPRHVDREHYLKVIEGKTASLISASARLGGMLSRMPAHQIGALATYGHHLGMAFQLSDDVLDLAGVPSESGKVPGTDLREGVHTLPVILALEAEGEHSDLRALLDEVVGTDDPELLKRARKVLADHPAFGLARDTARLESRRAVRALEVFEPTDATGPLVRGLADLAAHAVDRVG